MSGRQNDCFRFEGQCLGGLVVYFAALAVVERGDCDDTIFVSVNVGDTCLEMVFSAVFEDTFADVAHQAWKFIGSDMRMSVYDDGRICSEVHELVEDFSVVSAFG